VRATGSSPIGSRAPLTAHAPVLAKKLAKLCLDQFLRLQVGLLRLVDVVDFPVPSYTQMLGIGSFSIRHYYESGINCYLPIAVAALHAGVDLHRKINVLDFGCGAARQLLHFTRHFPMPRYHACDVNEPAISFVKRNYPEVHAVRNAFRPPLPFEPGYFDMVYSVSVFSHLSPEDQPLWLRELARVLKPGGCCLLSTQGFTGVERMGRGALVDNGRTPRETLAAHGLLYRDYADREVQKANECTLAFGSKYLGIDGSYGTTTVSPAYVAQHWPAFGFAVERVIEGIIDYRQDLVVLRRC
jgi:SAM-dependent methyltransferase